MQGRPVMVAVLTARTSGARTHSVYTRPQVVMFPDSEHWMLS